MHIDIITTGGTIDKDYPHITKGWAFEIGEPAVKEMLETWNVSFEYDVHSLLKKDSLEINDSDRQLLVDFIDNLEGNRLVITHGSDTMIQTGKYLQKQINDKTIILTGAMRPAKFKDSDAPLNIGAAISTVQLLKPGIYIAMNGIIADVNNTQRENLTGQFIKDL